MLEVKEFKTVEELNEYLQSDKKIRLSYTVVPLTRMFESPTTKLIVSCITYVLIMRY